MQDMVQSLILPGLFDGKDIPGTLHNADGAAVAGRVRANLTGFPVGQVLADRTGMNLLMRLQNGVGKFLCLVMRKVEKPPTEQAAINTDPCRFTKYCIMICPIEYRDVFMPRGSPIDTTL